ncbi:MAG: carbohydrate ABC transporter permease [Ruminococcus sp.]|nr:carbohydrate ABC transporter permease [Ruminococcus sp.]MCD7801174.1 carbohydrate ABC transporter permease [Ruminococcus sp.]
MAIPGSNSLGDKKFEAKISDKVHKASMTKEQRTYLRNKSLLEKVWPVFRFLILFGLCFVILYPLIFMISCAFRLQTDMNDPTVMWIPRHLTLSVIKETAEAMNFGETLKNTLLLNIGCSLVQVVTCAITGYGFARFNFKGKNILFAIVILMILVPQQIILIPQYTQFRYFMGTNINLINSPLTMYLPALMANGIRAGLMILIFRQFFKGLPKELEDAAYLDGCAPFRTFVQIMVPNAKSSFLIVFLFSVVWYWNDYYVSTSFFTENKTIALMLKNLDTTLNTTLFNSATAQVSVREKIVWMEAGCLISITPILVLYSCLQKQFVEGIERSGLTG